MEHLNKACPEVSWVITGTCNFSCHYCSTEKEFLEYNDRQASEVAQKLISILDQTDKEWHVVITGGEPFVVRNFHEICHQITQNHLITIDTNLSLDKPIENFIQTVNPSRVRQLYGAVHIEERAKHESLTKFVNRIHHLKKHGFPLKISYVLEPKLSVRFWDDHQFFKEHDIEIVPKPFKGIMEHGFRNLKMEYYDQKTKEILREFAKTKLKTTVSVTGVQCNSGKDFIRVMPNGDVKRCYNATKLMGNVLVDSFEFNLMAKECDVAICCHNGLKHVEFKPAEREFLNAIMSLKLGEFVRAKESLETGLKLDPNFASAYINLAHIAIQERQYELASTHLEKAKMLSPDHPTVKHHEEKFKMGEFDKIYFTNTIYFEKSRMM